MWKRLGTFLHQLLCWHRKSYLISIEWDGGEMRKCLACSKIFHRDLS